jgi:hypothetical protein
MLLCLLRTLTPLARSAAVLRCCALLLGCCALCSVLCCCALCSVLCALLLCSVLLLLLLLADRIAESCLEQLIVTDTIPMANTKQDLRAAKVKVLPIAPMLAEAIRSVHKVRRPFHC